MLCSWSSRVVVEGHDWLVVASVLNFSISHAKKISKLFSGAVVILGLFNRLASEDIKSILLKRIRSSSRPERVATWGSAYLYETLRLRGDTCTKVLAHRTHSESATSHSS